MTHPPPSPPQDMEPEDVRGRLRRRGGGLALAAALQGRDARSTPVPGRAGQGPARQEAGLLRVPAVQGVGQGEGGSGGRGGGSGGGMDVCYASICCRLIVLLAYLYCFFLGIYIVSVYILLFITFFFLLSLSFFSSLPFRELFEGELPVAATDCRLARPLSETPRPI